MSESNEATSVIDRYAVMGYPVSHSRSPVIHRLFAVQTGQNLHYELLEVEPKKLESAIKQFARTGGKGLNITLPHKSEVTRFVDDMSDRASTAGAINTLMFRDDEIYGDNTDGIGLIRDLTDNLEIELEGANILILGAGGSTRGILSPLLDEKPESIVIANRTMEKAKALAEIYSSQGPVSAISFKNIRTPPEFDLVINATSAGVKGETPPYPESAISDKTVCYDLSYSMKSTPFSSWAKEKGAARSYMGWGMLVEQAAESFYLWRDVRPDTAAVLKQLSVNV
ncbi:MAG: shikimate dehydrogenase [Woeseiaceae bacterium]|nr:shikimate dehydrogenase [Woeseiaceae bacterium]